MRILAIDSSSLVASVALVDEEVTIAEYTVNFKKTHSQTLLPMLEEIKKMLALDLESIDALAVSSGPGSFTGLRIGASTVKGLGLALSKPLVAIPTLTGLAYNLAGDKRLICPIMDARRGQVYTAVYRMAEEVEEIMPGSALPIAELLSFLNNQREEVIFLGDGVPAFQEQIEKDLSVPFAFALPHQNRQRAAAYGALALQYLKEGKTVTAAEFAPDYLRDSQAERERKERTRRDWVVKPIAKEDIGEIAELERRIFSDAWSVSGLEESYKREEALILGAYKEGKIYGYLVAYLAADECELMRLAVKEEKRKENAGTHLLLALESMCEDAGIKKIFLEVRESNKTAISFYESGNFIQDGVRPNFYDNPVEDGVLMSRELGK